MEDLSYKSRMTPAFLGLSLVLALAISIVWSTSYTNTHTTSTQWQAYNVQYIQQAPSANAMFSYLDVNNDNRLSQTEANDQLSHYFLQIDSNKDSFISLSEFENAPRPEHLSG